MFAFALVLLRISASRILAAPTTVTVNHTDLITDQFCSGGDLCVSAQRNTTSDIVTFTIQSSVSGRLFIDPPF